VRKTQAAQFMHVSIWSCPGSKTVMLQKHKSRAQLSYRNNTSVICQWKTTWGVGGPTLFLGRRLVEKSLKSWQAAIEW